MVPDAVRLLVVVLVGHLAPAQTLPDELTLFDGIVSGMDGGEAWYAEHGAMIEAESGFRFNAESPYAQGWAQFTPPTRQDWWKRIPGCEDADPFDPRCNAMAMHAYMQWLYKRSIAMVHAHEAAMAMARRAYNGGLGWQIREHRLCLATPGCDPGNWQHLAQLCMEAGRSEAACRENSEYPLKIEKFEPKYRKRKKGWKRKLLKGVAIGVSVAQGRVPEIR